MTLLSRRQTLEFRRELILLIIDTTEEGVIDVDCIYTCILVLSSPVNLMHASTKLT